MLTRELAIAEYDFAAGRIVPDRLTTKTHRRYVDYAERMLNLYGHGAGRTRRDLHSAVGAIFAGESDCPQRRIDAFCKLLDDASEFERDRRGQAASLRMAVFRMAASRHPLVRSPDRLHGSGESRVKLEIAASLGRPWPEIEAHLFGDVVDFHRLKTFAGFADGCALLSRYNVAQVQAALFDAESLSVWAGADFKTILRYAKLAKLMHTIVRLESGEYLFRFDGAASVVRETRRYGAALARFLPALLSCRDWKMHALVQSRSGSWKLSLDLSPADGLAGHLPPPDPFDSQVEEDFARRWGAEPREGWALIREGEVLQSGQKVFIPDFVFRHDDGRSMLMEIVGFWTPEYIEAKLATLRTFSGSPILLAVEEPVRRRAPDLGQSVIVFKSALKVKDVLSRLSGPGR